MFLWIFILCSQLIASENIKWEEYSIQCHLDVNGVILGQESIGDRVTPPEEYASIMLANGTYSVWVSGQQPKSYKAHVWEDLLPGPNNDPVLRQERKGVLQQFVKTLINENHPLAEKVSNQYKELISILGQQPIFPGFPHLIRSLQESNIPTHFIFRTFGKDGELIQKYLRETFPEIVLSLGEFDEDANFHFQEEDRESVIRDPSSFRELLKRGHWLIQDNFERWRKGREQGRFGKLFPFSSVPEDRVLSIFADDNLEIVMAPEERTIVCCYDITTKIYVSTQQASTHLIKVNPIEAALDPHYLTNQVMEKVKQLSSPSKTPVPTVPVSIHNGKNSISMRTLENFPNLEGDCVDKKL